MADPNPTRLYATPNGFLNRTSVAVRPEVVGHDSILRCKAEFIIQAIARNTVHG